MVRSPNYLYHQFVAASLKSRTAGAKGYLFIETQQRHLHPVYVGTHSNSLADALSRSLLGIQLGTTPQLDLFLSRLDITTLELSVQRNFQNGLVLLTHKTYQAAMKHFHTSFLYLYLKNSYVVSPF